MIFVTVGSQLPFDRLVRAVDDALEGSGMPAFAQIGQSSLQPRNMDFCQALSPGNFAERVRGAKLVVGHAGMGTVLTALEYGKPLVMLPRLGALRETRNDHQLATLQWLRGKPGLYAANDEQSLADHIRRFLEAGSLPAPTAEAECLPLHALCNGVRQFIEG